MKHATPKPWGSSPSSTPPVGPAPRRSPLARKAHYPGQTKSLPLLASLAFLLTIPHGAEAIQINAAYKKVPGVEATLTSVFSHTPTSGYLPAKLQLKNPTSRDLTWSIDASVSQNNYNSKLGSSSSLRVTCPANSEVERALLFPVPPILERQWNHSTRINLTLLGRGGSTHSDYDNLQAEPGWPSIAISEQLSARNRSALDKQAQSINPNIDQFGSILDPKNLPDEWRALAGIDTLMLTDNEWGSLGARQRRAILEWVHLGGTLDLYAKEGTTSLQELGFDVPKKNPKAPSPLGLGRLRLFTFNGEDLDAKEVCNRVAKSVARSRCLELAKDFRSGWGLADDFGTRPFRTSLWLGIITLFAILVGTINLFILAGKNRRHRLFVTTPIIALATSLLFGALILAIDGLGGRGHRLLAIELQPGEGERNAYLTQQSILSTGLLTGTSFQEKTPALHLPVSLPPSRWARVTGSRDSGQYNITADGLFQGDWLQSRSRHGFSSQTTVPTRARIELAGTPDAPELVSGLGFPVEKVFYKDPQGQLWQSADKLATGEKATLQPATREEFAQWRKTQTEPASKGLGKDLRRHAAQNGHFYAHTTTPTGMELNFGDSIRWQHTTTFLHGPVLTP